MIIVHLMGGLGNQMFQYAAAKSLAIKLQTSLKYYFRDYYPYAKREFTLNKFNIKLDNISYLDMFKIKLSKHNSAFLYRKEEKEYYKFDLSFFDLPKNTLLKGFWQSYKYFIPYDDFIKKDFEITLNDIKTINLANEINNLDSISIHIRRGDYISSSVTNKAHGTCTLNYYLEAISLIKKQVENPHFYVFSDDIQWAKNNLKISGTLKFIENIKNEIIELKLMTLCKYNIIANSSFSWWGGYLNKYPNKIIIAPKKWTNSISDISEYDLIPPGWILI